MTQKCERKGLPLTPESALIENRDAIGLRIVCNFIDDIYTCIDLLKKQDNFKIINEKDYITDAKPNGYRSYHLVIKVVTPFEDVHGNQSLAPTTLKSSCGQLPWTLGPVLNTK